MQPLFRDAACLRRASWPSAAWRPIRTMPVTTPSPDRRASTPPDAADATPARSLTPRSPRRMAPERRRPPMERRRRRRRGRPGRSQDAASFRTTAALPPYNAGEHLRPPLRRRTRASSPFAYVDGQGAVHDAARRARRSRPRKGTPRRARASATSASPCSSSATRSPAVETIQKCGSDHGCSDANSCYLVHGLCATPINNCRNGQRLDGAVAASRRAAASHTCPTQ